MSITHASRHHGLPELPALRNLGDHGEMPAGKVFGHLMTRYEHLPYLGDSMFHALLQRLIHSPCPLLREGTGEGWAQRILRLTPLGERVLAGEAHWLDQTPATRWVGGVQIDASKTAWMVDDEGRVTRR
jgi:hypothetical protein